MPSLKILGQELSPSVAAEPAPSDPHWRSVAEYQGLRGLGATVVDSFDLLTGAVGGKIESAPRGVTRVEPDSPVPDSLSRRSFMQLLGGGVGLAGLEGCFKPPNGTLLPYAKQGADQIPGEPLHYTSGLELDGRITPLLVTCFDGRPIKVEGNPDHPENLGATGVFEQTLLEQLYDPTRAQDVQERGQTRSEDSLRHELQAALHPLEASGGAGLRLLCAPTSSPVLLARRQKLLARFPHAQIVEYSPMGFEASAGTQAAFGSAMQPTYALGKADVVVSLDADFLWTEPYGQRMAREFAARRSPQGGVAMNRLYSVEANLSITGMMADHRLRARSSELGQLALALLHEVLVQKPLAGLNVPPAQPNDARAAKFVQAAARDLIKAQGRSAVLVGPRQPPEVQAVGHLLNLALGNVGNTVSYHAAEVATPGTSRDLAALVKDIDQKQVAVLIVTAENPVFSAPADLDLGARLAAVPFSLYLAPYDDDTAKRALWTAPAAHPFELWGDGRAADGSLVIQQPLLAPLFGGKGEMDVLGWLIKDATPTHDVLRTIWGQAEAAAIPSSAGSAAAAMAGSPAAAAMAGSPAAAATAGSPAAAATAGSPDDRWAALLRTGFSAAPSRTPVTPQPGGEASAALGRIAKPAGAAQSLELELYPSYQVHDGRFGRNGWLLELPDPVTKLTWTNAALVSPKTAERLNLQAGDVVELALGGHSLKLPASILPGHADDAVSVALGFGHPAALAVGGLAGANAYVLRQSKSPWFASGLTLKKTGETHALALTQEHWSMEHRELAIELPVSAMGHQEHLAGERHPAEDQPSFYEPVKYDGLKWAMAIDLARCSGCSACVVACQSENNIPIVGEDQVGRGREMHWLRLDRYFTGESLDDPGAIAQPVACVHCENAPCEYVCPVGATVHSDEGLNDMVYNRCVGTRYCSNNCPYHVRRFNFLNYAYGNKTETEKMAVNPEVTVRSRGVMEKCTYCVQRIERGRIGARIAGRELRDGDIRTACQSACPTQAISFGTLSDPKSQVSRWRDDPRSYLLLKELGTRPRTSHLVRLKNKNPELA